MFGADIAVAPGPHLPEAVRGSNNGRLADVVVVCAGALSAAEQALECVDRGGTVLYFAVPEPGVMLSVPINDLWRNEVRLMTSYGASPGDIEKAVTLLAGGRVKLDDMITHRLGFNEGGRGFKLVAGGTESIKVIFDPWKDS
jgi:L-iditol 2-dehydrogenase